MSIEKRALHLMSLGFNVFPLGQNGKTPIFKKYTEKSSNLPKDIFHYWEQNPHYNIGIATSKFLRGALLVVDVDNKNGKNGSETIVKMELNGFEFPKTLTQKTPTGGFHLIYKVKEPVKQSVSQVGPGLDIRSRGGYIVGAGSLIDNQPYLINSNPIVDAPEWLIKKANEKKQTERKVKDNVNVNQNTAKKRVKEYLQNHAPESIKGQGGDQTAYQVVAKIKDMGLKKENCLEMLMKYWFEGSGWTPEKLLVKIENAYSYGQNEIGADSPENDFEPIEDDSPCPVEKLNEEFSFIVLGGKSTILRKEKDGDISYMGVQAFHDLLMADKIQNANGNWVSLSKIWFSSPKRLTYNSIELHPLKKAPPGVYNLWRGFSCKPLGANESPTPDMIEGVRLFKEHLFENVCQKDKELFDWIMGYFAQLIQKPYEKPLTALVFKGDKGVGKNATIDIIGNLFNGHYLLTSNRRYLTSNFNKHLANLLLFVLDEANWAGDKQAEGILKDLITGHTHLIEQKGREMFSTNNLLRLVIIGNEDWIVPATKDERRFAVFNISDKRQGDKKYFIKMKNLIENKGGNRLLLKELMDFDLKSVDINKAPETEGLLDQKLESLNSIHSWWYSCLKEGAILGNDFNQIWPEKMGRGPLRDAYLSYAKGRGIRSWLPDAAVFGKTLKKCIPEIKSRRLGKNNDRTYSYVFPLLERARAQFERFIGFKIVWEDEEIDSNVIDAVDLFS